MIEFALTMQQFAGLTHGQESKEAKEFNELAKCYAT